MRAVFGAGFGYEAREMDSMNFANFFSVYLGLEVRDAIFRSYKFCWCFEIQNDA